MSNLVESYLEEIQLNEFIITPAILLIMAVYKRYLSKAARSCSSYKGAEKSKCIVKFQIVARKVQLSELGKLSKKCNEDKNSESCYKAIKNKREKVTRSLNKLALKYKKFN